MLTIGTEGTRTIRMVPVVAQRHMCRDACMHTQRQQQKWFNSQQYQGDQQIQQQQCKKVSAIFSEAKIRLLYVTVLNSHCAYVPKLSQIAHRAPPLPVALFSPCEP